VHALLGREAAVREQEERRGLAALLTGRRQGLGDLRPAAERHGVLGLLADDVAARALQSRGLRALKFTLRAVEAVEKAGIGCVVLKGSAAATRWREPAARQQSDLDLLVTRADLKAATRALIDAGVASHAFMAGDHIHNASLLPAQPSGLMIELHHALNSNHEISVDVRQLINRRVHLESPQGKVPALTSEDDAAYLAMHAATHAIGRLAWLVDLEGLGRAGVDWEEAAGRARAWNVALPVECAWREARALLEVPIPDAAFRKLGTSAAQRAAIAALYRATWATAGTAHVWLERAFRLSLVPPSDWPRLAVHKARARKEEQDAYA